MDKDFKKGVVKKAIKHPVKDSKPRVTYTLSKSQSEAVAAIKEWKNNSTSNVFTLSGAAGTGKTFVVKYIILQILKGKRSIVSAPTHKAVRVIEKFTGVTGATLHSLHGLRPNFNLDDFSLTKLKFESLGAIKIDKYDYIIIDESSMIGKDLHKLNMIKSLQFNTRIIYVGDTLQLPPVKESGISVTFESRYGYELTEIIRQKQDNPLLTLLGILREDVINNTAKFINYIRKNPSLIRNDIGYNVFNYTEFTKGITESFNSEYHKHTSEFKVGAYTNKAVQQWNRHIRRLITDSKELIAVNDVLMSYKTVVDEYLSPIIVNSSDYRVIEVTRKISDYKFYIFNVTLQDIETKNISNVYIVDHTDGDSFRKFYVKLYQVFHTAMYCDDPMSRGKKWKEYYAFKERYMTMIDFELQDKSGSKVAYIKKEIDYGYAVTIHKLQGSTIKNMFVDCRDILYYNSNPRHPRVNTRNNKNVINLRNRLLYTGLSRTSEIANLYI